MARRPAYSLRRVRTCITPRYAEAIRFLPLVNGGYHGHYGFRTFTHERAVAHHSFDFNVSEMMVPPFTKRKKRIASGYLGAMQVRTRLKL